MHDGGRWVIDTPHTKRVPNCGLVGSDQNRKLHGWLDGGIAEVPEGGSTLWLYNSRVSLLQVALWSGGRFSLSSIDEKGASCSDP